MALVASCAGQNIGSPIQDDLDAVPVAADHEAAGRKAGNVEFELKVEAGESFHGAAAQDSLSRGVSFTPGLPVGLIAGLGTANVLGYGWRGGRVTDGAAPSWVGQDTDDKRKPAWIM